MVSHCCHDRLDSLQFALLALEKILLMQYRRYLLLCVAVVYREHRSVGLGLGLGLGVWLGLGLGLGLVYQVHTGDTAARMQYCDTYDVFYLRLANAALQS